MWLDHLLLMERMAEFLLVERVMVGAMLQEGGRVEPMLGKGFKLFREKILLEGLVLVRTLILEDSVASPV